jgi:hypothetical protein
MERRAYFIGSKPMTSQPVINLALLSPWIDRISMSDQVRKMSLNLIKALPIFSTTMALLPFNWSACLIKHQSKRLTLDLLSDYRRSAQRD